MSLIASKRAPPGTYGAKAAKFLEEALDRAELGGAAAPAAKRARTEAAADGAPKRKGRQSKVKAPGVGGAAAGRGAEGLDEQTDDDDDEGEDEEEDETSVAAVLARQARRVRKAGDGFGDELAYFSTGMGTRRPARTSGRTLAQLDLADEAEISDLLNTRLPLRQPRELREMQREVETRFPRWRCALDADLSVFLYGLGSKRSVLERFADSVSERGHVVTVAGYLPGLNLRAALLHVAQLLREGDAELGVEASGSISDATLTGMGNDEIVDYIRSFSKLVAVGGEGKKAGLRTARAASGKDLEEFVPDGGEGREAGKGGTKTVERCPVYVVLHSLDGPSLRTKDAVGLVSYLASAPCVRLIGSLDGLNSGLLFDRRSLGRFAPMWEEVTTFMPYGHEVCSVQPLVTGRGSERRIKGAFMVLRSLTERARGIFKVLADWQLAELGRAAEAAKARETDADKAEEAAQVRAQGAGSGVNAVAIAFSDFYSACRDAFVATSEVQLRGVLTEFKDHQIVKVVGRSREGGDLLAVDLPSDELRRVLADLEGERTAS